jgi:hypothetical protein
VIRLAAALLLALTLTVQAQRISIDPPGPTSVTPVEARLYVSCDPQSHTLERIGNVIKIHVTPGPIEAICDPPVAVLYRVPIGTLPAGEYRIDVTVGARDQVFSRSFVVRNGAPSRIEIHPFAVPTHPFGLRLHISSELGIAKIFIDDVQIAPESITLEESGLTFPAPMHAAGLVDVRIETTGGAMHTLPGGLYYYDHATPPDPSVFERILFPVLFSAAGAHGSQWVSEAAIANPRPWYIETFNEVMPFECIDYPCGERIAPDSYVAFSGAGFPQGVALIAPRAEAHNLSFSLRVRDTSRAAEGYGTQVPVVREDDMFRGTELTLLDVPVDSRYRTKVRMYVFDSGDHDAEVTVDDGDQSPSTYFVALRRNCSGIACHATPWYAEVDLATTALDKRVNLYIRMGANDSPAWAFASVTNNETQQVTIVTPDGTGGQP